MGRPIQVVVRQRDWSNSPRDGPYELPARAQNQLAGDLAALSEAVRPGNNNPTKVHAHDHGATDSGPF